MNQKTSSSFRRDGTRTPDTRSGTRAGFTLVEVMVAASLTIVVVTGALAVHLAQQRNWRATELQMETDSEANLAINRIVYGAGGHRGVRAASRASVTNEGSTGWTLTYITSGSQTNTLRYRVSLSNLVYTPGPVVLAEHVAAAPISVLSDGSQLSVTVRVDQARGTFRARREAGTTIRLRNFGGSS